MATRPTPKKSSFGGTHSIEHAQDVLKATAQPHRSAVAVTEPAASAGPLAPADTRRKPGPVPGGKIKKKAAVWADEEVIERIRGAWFHTPTTSAEREASFSDFLLQAALARTAEREQKYNQGDEFPAAPAGTIGVGRKG